MRRFSCLLALGAGLFACADDGFSSGPKPSKVEAAEVPTSVLPAWGIALHHRDAALEAAEFQRNPVAEALESGLASDDPSTRDRAAWSLARIGADGSRERLASLASEPSATSSLLATIAFLEPPPSQRGEAPIPEGGWADLERQLWTRYAVTEQRDEAAALLLAIARVGGPRSQALLAADLAVLPSTKPESERFLRGMEAAGVLCARGHALDRGGLQAIDTALGAKGAAQLAAAYALGRCASASAELLAGSERGALVARLDPLAQKNDDTARLAWKALAGLGELPATIPPSILGKGPPTWMVEVEAVRALAGHADGRTVLVDRLAVFRPSMIRGPRTHVVLEALRGLRTSVAASKELLPQLDPLREAIGDSPDKAHALARCELLLLRAIDNGEFGPVRSCTTGRPDLPASYGARLAVEGMLVTEHVDGLLSAARDQDAVVAAAALAALADVSDPRVNAALRDALARDDLGVLAAAASAIGSIAVDAKRRDEATVGALASLVRRLDNGTAVEARIAAIEALGNLARSAPGKGDAHAPWLIAVIVPLASDANRAVRDAARAALLGNPELVARFDDAAKRTEGGGFTDEVAASLQESASGLRVELQAGSFEIAFDGAMAPIAQSTLTALARKGYFDGLRFHRVVPGFVIQGGDPRGDGYGGPGYVMPCERSNLRYVRGTVGIALAGKDTGGSQFFVAQSRQPHLDSRYTVIGHITRGMEIVDRVLPHDIIEKVEVLP